jgi:hypothetical protein
LSVHFIRLNLDLFRSFTISLGVAGPSSDLTFALPLILLGPVQLSPPFLFPLDVLLRIARGQMLFDLVKSEQNGTCLIMIEVQPVCDGLMDTERETDLIS